MRHRPRPDAAKIGHIRQLWPTHAKRRAGVALVGLLAVALAVPVGAQIPPESLGSPELPGQEVLTGARYLDEEFGVELIAEDVAYGQNVNSRGRLQDLLLDVYEPVGNEEEFRPAVIWVHGGGFASGDKRNFSFGTDWLDLNLHELTRRGYVGVSINYRLRPEGLTGGGVPSFLEDPQRLLSAVDNAQGAAADAMEDAKAAVRWVRANAADLRVDPGHIVLAGGSAGGITALGAAYNSEEPGNSGHPGWPSHVAAAIAHAGGYIPGFLGRPVLPGDPPIAIHHAANDVDVPAPVAIAPCANTAAMGNVCEAYLYPYEDGNWQYYHALRRHSERIGARNASFLYRHVISQPRVTTSFEETGASTKGDTATVSGRLVDEHAKPLARARVLGRATAGWAETTTGEDGGFSLTVEAPEHGKSTGVLVRYEGHSTGSWLDGPQIAPTHTTVSATWGATL